MRQNWTVHVLPFVLLAGVAHADFTGQPIVGVLSDGSLVTGTTAGKADDNDGFESGTHVFGIWDGGDDVYKINWLGGDMTVTLSNIGGGVDNDLFIYLPTDLDSSGDYSILGGSFTDSVTIVGAAAGTYYVNVDSTFLSEGGYRLSVIPTPATAVLLGMGALAVNPHIRRRR